MRRVRHKGVVDLIREQYFLFRFGNGGVVIVAVRINYIRSAYCFRGIFGYGYAAVLSCVVEKGFAYCKFRGGCDANFHSAFYCARYKRGGVVCAFADVSDFQTFKLSAFFPYGEKVAERLQRYALLVC